MSTVEAVEKTRTTNPAASHADIGLLVLRVITFGILAVHGSQKLFGAFGGPGLSGTAKMFEQMGYQPAELFALVAGASELTGGILLVLGLLTPLGSAIALGVMINATTAVLGMGLTVFGYPIVIGAAAIALAISGPGRFSLDHGRPWSLSGPAPAAVSIVLGVLAAVVTLVVS